MRAAAKMRTPLCCFVARLLLGFTESKRSRGLSWRDIDFLNRMLTVTRSQDGSWTACDSVEP